MNALDKLAGIQPFNRISWPIDEEPIHLPKSDYYLDHMPMTGVPYWSESDDNYRLIIKAEISKKAEL